MREDDAGDLMPASVEGSSAEPRQESSGEAEAHGEDDGQEPLGDEGAAEDLRCEPCGGDVEPLRKTPSHSLPSAAEIEEHR